MGFYRKKPVTIEARQFTGGNADALLDWINEHAEDRTAYSVNEKGHIVLMIETLEGTHRAQPRDWIILGVAGEFYSCKPGIFKETYEAAPHIDRESAPRIRTEHLGERP